MEELQSESRVSGQLAGQLAALPAAWLACGLVGQSADRLPHCLDG